MWLAIIPHRCFEGYYCHSNPAGCHYMASSWDYLFFPMLPRPHSCVCVYAWAKCNGLLCAHSCVCVYRASVLALHISGVPVCSCVCVESKMLFSPRVHNLLLLYDKCVLLQCMCGLKMKRLAGPCRSSTYCVQTHHYWYGSIDCLLVCFSLFVQFFFSVNCTFGQIKHHTHAKLVL